MISPAVRLTPPKNYWECDYLENEPVVTRGQSVIRFIHRNIFVPDGMLLGEPMRLLDFQKKFICDVYDNPHGTRRAVLSIARKNGKTALIASLVLAHLAGTLNIPNTEIHSGALSLEQAAHVFELASKMVRSSPNLAGKVKIIPSKKKLVWEKRNIVYKATSAESKTAHGGSPVVAILDELGQVKEETSAFYEAVVSSQGAHKNPLCIIISTQAPSDEALLSKIIDAPPSKQTIKHVYCATPEAALDDVAQWHDANPALGKFNNINNLEAMAELAVTTPSFEAAFRNLHLNQRIDVETKFVTPQTWKSLRLDKEPQDIVRWWGGLDLSMKNDLTAFVMLGETENIEGDDVEYVRSHFWLPEQALAKRSPSEILRYREWERQGHITICSGAGVQLADVVRYVYNLDKQLGFETIFYDRWGIETFKKLCEIEEIELPLIEFQQGFRWMSPAIMELQISIANKKIRHDGNPLLTMCLMNAKIKRDNAGNQMFTKKDQKLKVDGAVALAMCYGAMAQLVKPEKEKVIDYQGGLLLL